MTALLIGVALLIYTVWNFRSEEADPLLFSDFFTGVFDVTRMEHPFIYWAAVTLQVLVAVGAVALGLYQVLT